MKRPPRKGIPKAAEAEQGDKGEISLAVGMSGCGFERQPERWIQERIQRVSELADCGDHTANVRSTSLTASLELATTCKRFRFLGYRNPAATAVSRNCNRPSQ